MSRQTARLAERRHAVIALAVEALVRGILRELDEPFVRTVAGEVRSFASLGRVEFVAVGAVEREVGEQLAAFSDQCGVAFVALRNTGHIGAAGHYALEAAKVGCLSMVTGNDMPSVAAPGSTKAVLGSNPLAYAIPTGGDPVLLDMATAAVAGGKVYAAYQRGESIPATWLIGPDGLPTTDGSLYPHAAALAPMAGHKGYGLGLWCEVLSALIPGGAMTWQVGSWIFDAPSKPSLHNASFFVADVDAMTDRAVFNHRMKALIDEIHAAPTAEGVASVLIPGEREFQTARDAAQNGIAIPEDVRIKLRECADLVYCPVPHFLK